MGLSVPKQNFLSESNLKLSEKVSCPSVFPNEEHSLGLPYTLGHV